MIPIRLMIITIITIMATEFWYFEQRSLVFMNFVVVIIDYMQKALDTTGALIYIALNTI